MHILSSDTAVLYKHFLGLALLFIQNHAVLQDAT
jgi:hypothetical protein